MQMHMKMIRIIARNESIQSIISRLEDIGIHGMTRLKISEENEFASAFENVSLDSKSSWEMILIVIPDDREIHTISSLKRVLCNRSKRDPLLEFDKDIHISVNDVEKEFDIS